MRGHVEQVSRRQIRGWVYDADRPDKPLDVEVTLDCEIIARTRADRPRADLAALNVGRDNFAFQLEIPPDTPLDMSRLAVRVADSGQPLPMAMGAGEYEGVIEMLQGSVVSGWAWRVGYPTERVRLQIRCDGALIKSFAADQYRADLAGSRVGDGAHGFFVDFGDSAEVYDSQQIRLVFEDTGAALHDLTKAGPEMPFPPVSAMLTSDVVPEAASSLPQEVLQTIHESIDFADGDML